MNTLYPVVSGRLKVAGVVILPLLEYPPTLLIYRHFVVSQTVPYHKLFTINNNTKFTVKIPNVYTTLKTFKSYYS